MTTTLPTIAIIGAGSMGGAILGGIAGVIGYKMMARIDEHAIEVLISLALVAGTYAVAQNINILGHHLSGPIAVVVAGLMIGNKGAAFANDQNSTHALVRFGAVHLRHQPLTHSMGKCIYRRVLNAQNRNVAMARIADLVLLVVGHADPFGNAPIWDQHGRSGKEIKAQPTCWAHFCLHQILV